MKEPSTRLGFQWNCYTTLNEICGLVPEAAWDGVLRSLDRVMIFWPLSRPTASPATGVNRIKGKKEKITREMQLLMRWMIQLSDYKTGPNGFHPIALSRWKISTCIFIFLLILVYGSKIFIMYDLISILSIYQSHILYNLWGQNRTKSF